MVELRFETCGSVYKREEEVAGALTECTLKIQPFLCKSIYFFLPVASHEALLGPVIKFTLLDVYAEKKHHLARGKHTRGPLITCEITLSQTCRPTGFMILLNIGGGGGTCLINIVKRNTKTNVIGTFKISVSSSIL